MEFYELDYEQFKTETTGLEWHERAQKIYEIAKRMRAERRQLRVVLPPTYDRETAFYKVDRPAIEMAAEVVIRTPGQEDVIIKSRRPL